MNGGTEKGFTEDHVRHPSASLRFQTGLADFMSKSRRMLVKEKKVKGQGKGDKVDRLYLRVKYVTSRRVLHPTIRRRRQDEVIWSLTLKYTHDTCKSVQYPSCRCVRLERPPLCASPHMRRRQSGCALP